jgi:hypothetical protein
MTWRLLALILLAGAGSARATDAACDFQAPAPLLRAGAYTDYAFREKPQNETVESATVRPGLRVLIRRNRCIHAIGTTFRLEADRPAGAARDRRYWINVALAEIGALRLADQAVADALTALLRRARSANVGGDTVALCDDGHRAPPRGCAPVSGGGVVEVKQRGATVAVSAGIYSVIE